MTVSYDEMRAVHEGRRLRFSARSPDDCSLCGGCALSERGGEPCGNSIAAKCVSFYRQDGIAGGIWVPDQ